MELDGAKGIHIPHPIQWGANWSYSEFPNHGVADKTGDFLYLYSEITRLPWSIPAILSILVWRERFIHIPYSMRSDLELPRVSQSHTLYGTWPMSS